MMKYFFNIVTLVAFFYFVALMGTTLPVTGVFVFWVALPVFFILLACFWRLGELCKIGEAQNTINSQIHKVEASIERLREFVRLARTLVNNDTESLIVDYIERNKLMVEKENDTE